MGSCLSKKSPNASPLPLESAASVANSAPPPPPPPPTDLNNKGFAQVVAGKKMAATGQVDGEDCVKKEIFVIKHRKSHDKRAQDKSPGLTPTPESPQICNPISSTTDCGDGGSNAAIVNVIAASAAAAPIRTSSCSKEELDAILIQCGRLSRSSSGNGKAAASSGGRKYSGSKRSYDFDHHCGNGNDDGGDDKKGGICDIDDDGDDIDDNQKKGHHERRSRGSPSPHGRRRRTPSREREQQQQQRSGSSRERGAGASGGSERRVSRSPAKRRSENASNGNGSSTRNGRPGKIVSVPATVSSSSLVMDKSNNEPPATTTSANIKRVSVKRNVGEGVTRGAASPRSQSPAKVANHSNVEVFNDNQDVPSSHQHQPSLSRSSSRKVASEQSPYRRRPLNEISSNSLVLPQHSNKTTNGLVSQAPMVKPNVEETNNNNCKVVAQGTGNSRITSKSAQDNKVVVMTHRAKEDQHQNVVQQLKPNTSSVESMSVLVASGAESLNPQRLTRSRSSRLSRDLDLNPEALLNTTASAASYATLLLEDIQNFHQKSSNNSSFSLPPCVTKACSILDAVADLNSCTSSDRLSSPLQLSSNANYDLSCGTNLRSAKNEYGASGDPFVESELVVCDDLMEPSLHKYVTLRRGTVVGGGDGEEIESSGSNSFMSGGQQLWEPNSANSTDRSNTRELDGEKAPRRLTAKKKRDSEPQQTRIDRSRVGASRVAAST